MNAPYLVASPNISTYLIIIKFRYQKGARPFQVSTQITVPQDNWNAKRKRVVGHPAAHAYNNTLDHYMAEIETFALLERRQGREVTKETLRRFAHNMIVPKTEEVKTTAVAFTEPFYSKVALTGILEPLAGTLAGAIHLSPSVWGPKPLPLNYLQQFTRTVQQLQLEHNPMITAAYEQANVTTTAQRWAVFDMLVQLFTQKKQAFTFEEVDIRFEHYLTELFHQRGYLGSTANKKMSQFRTYMRRAQRAGYHRTSDYHLFKYQDKISSGRLPKKSDFYLTRGQVLALQLFEGTDQQNLVRDEFLLLYFFNLRYEELFGLHPKHRRTHAAPDGSVWHSVEFFSPKGGKVKRVPIHPTAAEILERRKWNLPNIGNSLFGKQLKAIFKRMGYDAEHTYYLDRAGKIERVTGVIHEIVSAHSARHLSTTHLKEMSGIELASQFAGHADIAVTQRHYDKSTAANVAAKLYESLFFRPEN